MSFIGMMCFRVYNVHGIIHKQTYVGKIILGYVCILYMNTEARKVIYIFVVDF